MSSENPYLDLLNTEEQRVATTDSQNAAPSKNPYLDTLEADDALRRSQQRAVLRTAVPVNPDQAAQAKALASKRNLTDEVVLRNLQDVQYQDAIDRADDRLLTSPALSKKMLELPFARVAHDNVENLANIEARIKTYGELKAFEGPAPTFGSYIGGLAKNFTGGAVMARDGIRMQLGDLRGRPDKRAERSYLQAQAEVQNSTPAFESETAKGVFGGVASTLRAIPGIAASIIARSPTPALAAMGVQAEAEAYGKYRGRGADPGLAFAGAVGEGAVEVLTEKIPMGFLVDKFGKAGAKEFLAGMLLREAPTEQVATFLQDAIDTAVANPDKTWGEFWKERPAAAYQTLIATVVQSSVMGGASTAVQRVAQRNERQQKVAERDTQMLTDLLKMAEKDKLRERDPQAFAEVVQAAATEHKMPTEVFIDANALVETLAQSGMTPEQIEGALPGAKDQLPAALAAGGDVAVPVGEFAALVGGSGFEQQLVQHVRMSPDSLSQADAKLLAKTDLRAETEKAVAEQADPVAPVRTALLDQLNAAGRFSPAVNAAYADSVTAFYETQAARLGITPQEMFGRYPLAVKAEVTPGASLEQAPASVQVDENGMPEIAAEGLFIGFAQPAERLEFIPSDNGEQMLNVVVYGSGDQMLGYVEATFKAGRPVAIYDIFIDPEVRGKGAAERTVKALLDASADAKLDISNIVPEARGFWAKLGIGEQNVEGAYDGTITPESFASSPAGEKRRRATSAVGESQGPGAGADRAAQGLNQVGTRGTFTPSTNTITLLAKADLSTFLHETGHFYLEVLADMASQPGAPAGVSEDMGKVLEWFGWKGAPADWAAQDVDTRRENHEQFARGFEAYLLEGKAPSTALSRVFSRFRSWLTSIYKTVRGLNVEINDDIRGVFDRLLATEEAIKEAQAARNYAPLFADEKAITEVGVDPAAYHALGAEATAEAIDALAARSVRDMRWLANAKSRALKAMQAEAKEKRKVIEAQVREEVGAMPVYRAADLLVEADKEFADDPFAADPAVRRGAIADALGFTSIDAMGRAIENAEPRKQVIDGMTDQRMLEEHGELSSPDALERAAEEAIHNEARGKFIATELSALNKALGPARVLVAAAKQFAEAVIGRKTLKDIKPHVFAAAETRAAKLAEKALGKSTDEAATAKRNQLLNHYAAKHAHDALHEIERIREFFKRVADTPDDRLKSRDIDVVNAARAVLAAYGVGRRGEAASEYLKKVAAYDPEMSQVLQGSVDAALGNAKLLDELTLDELRALNDEVASLWHLAKRSRQMEVDGDLMDREEVQNELKARLDEIGIPDTMPGDASAITPAEQRLAKLKTYLASARRTEGWVEAMDGKSSGVFRSYIWQPVKEAADAYRTDRAKLLKQYRALLSTIAPTLRKRTVDAPELGYTFGKDTGGVAMNEILHAILHTGNASNKRKLLIGRKWGTELADGSLDTRRWDAFIRRLATEGVLTKAHFDFAQGVWDLLETAKPLAQKTHRDVFGKYFNEITADALDTPFGQYRGGYVPAQADPRIVSDAKTRQLMEAENDSMSLSFPATKRGFAKDRVEYNRPLTLDLGTLAQHIDKVLLFGHMERPIRDVRRVLTAKGVAYGVNRIDPAAFDAIISPWLNRAARQQVTTPSPGHWQSWRLWSTLRNRAGMNAMFGNIVNAAQQITGFSIAAVKVRPKYLLGAMAHYVTSPRQMSQDVAAASPYMEGRISNEIAAMNDAIKDILIDPSLYERGQQWSMRHAYFLQSAVDNVLSPIIWIAARNQALEQGQSDKEAGRFADATVRQTQGSTLPEDISNWEAGSSFSRMFSQFAGYFNMQANLLGTEFQTIARDMGLRKGAGRGLYVLTLAFLAPAWVSELIVQAFRGGPDDEDKDGEYLDDWFAALGWATLRGATAMVPIFGQGVNALVNAGNSKPYDDRLATSPAISMLEAAVKAPFTLYDAIFEDKDKSKAVKDVASLISITTGIPANVAARPLSYAVDVQEGDVRPTGPVDAARGALTGRASPGSK